MATIRFTDNDKSGGKLVNSFFTKEATHDILDVF